MTFNCSFDLNAVKLDEQSKPTQLYQITKFTYDLCCNNVDKLYYRNILLSFVF